PFPKLPTQSTSKTMPVQATWCWIKTTWLLSIMPFPLLKNESLFPGTNTRDDGSSAVEGGYYCRVVVVSCFLFRSKRVRIGTPNRIYLTRLSPPRSDLC